MYRTRPMPLVSQEEMAIRAIRVESDQLVFVRHALEASEGIGFLIARKGGHALLVTPRSQEDLLDEFIADMVEEVGLSTATFPEHEEAFDVALS